MKNDEDIIVRNLDYFTPNDGIEYYYLQFQCEKNRVNGFNFVIIKEDTYNEDNTEVLFCSTNIFGISEKWKEIRKEHGKWSIIEED